MKFAEDHNEARYKITGYETHGIKINGSLFTDSMILTPMDLITDWEPTHFTDLHESHLDAIYALQPDVVIIGTGEQQVFPPPAILRRLAAEKIGFEIMSTAAACRTFNIIMSEGRNIVAALFMD